MEAKHPLPIYLDHHSTTPLDPLVLEEMLPYLRENFGNPSSTSHIYGRMAARAVEKARRRVAALIGASPDEIIFTASATEANNLAVKGVMAAHAGGSKRLIVSAMEHSSVMEAGRRLRKSGFECEVLPVPSTGLLDPDVVASALRRPATLVSVIHAGNEVGVIQDVEAIAAICRERGALFHSDAAQSVAYALPDVRRIDADLLTLSSHKIYGPKGAGALWVRNRRPSIALEALLDGGGQERGLRSGTLDTAAIAGFGKAAEIALREGEDDARRIARLRDLLKSILERMPGLVFPGAGQPRLPGNLNVSVPHVQASAIMSAMPGVAVSSTSACSSEAGTSRILRALGLERHVASGTLRFGLGRFTTEDEVRVAAALFEKAVDSVRSASGLGQEESDRQFG